MTFARGVTSGTPWTAWYGSTGWQPFINNEGRVQSSANGLFPVFMFKAPYTGVLKIETPNRETEAQEVRIVKNGSVIFPSNDLKYSLFYPKAAEDLRGFFSSGAHFQVLECFVHSRFWKWVHGGKKTAKTSRFWIESAILL